MVLSAVLGAAALSAACGQKGALYLPDAKEGQDKQPRSAVSEQITTPAIPTAPSPGLAQ
jgi:predicted small lipoprotein YifL